MSKDDEVIGPGNKICGRCGLAIVSYADHKCVRVYECSRCGYETTVSDKFLAHIAEHLKG